MLYLPRQHAAFLHIPKCGGMAIRRAIIAAGIPAYGRGYQIGDAQHARETCGPDVRLFTVIRNPLTWYASYWCDRMINGWGGDLLPGRMCESHDFERFVRNCLHECPGFVSKELYPRYMAKDVFVERLENIRFSLNQALRCVGCEQEVPEVPPTNLGSSLPVLRDKCVLSEELRDRLIAVEMPVIEQYYRELIPAKEDS